MELTRRDLLKRAGVAAAAAATLPATARVAWARGGMDEGEDDEVPSSRIRRYAMVIDLRRCDGCEGLGVPPQCTQYCNWARLVPEGHQWVEVYESPENDLPGAPPRFLPAVCMQCQNAPCTNVCPVGATFHTPEGVVLVDQERCIGCRLCMAACPYDRRFFNWAEPEQPDWVKHAPYNPQTQVPALRGTVMKCDFCTDRAAAGGLPSCVEGCPRGAMYFGDLEEDVATNGTEFVKLSRFIEENHASRFKEDLGTEPRVYYVPGHGEDAPPASSQAMGTGPKPFAKDRLEWIGSTLRAWERQHPMPAIPKGAGPVASPSPMSSMEGSDG